MAVDMSERLQELGDQVKPLREAEEKTSWSEIASQLGVGQGKAMLAYLFVSTAPKDRIKGKTEEELKAKIVTARNSGLSWAIISARCGRPESWCRSAYTETTGKTTLGLRIGKGGRHPGGTAGTAPAKKAVAKKAVAKKAVAKKAVATKQPAAKSAPAKKAVAKKATAKKAASGSASGGSTTSGRKTLVEMNLEELDSRLAGQTIAVDRDGGKRQDSYQVRRVTGLENGTMSYLDVKSGNTRMVKVEDIRKASITR